MYTVRCERQGEIRVRREVSVRKRVVGVRDKCEGGMEPWDTGGMRRV